MSQVKVTWSASETTRMQELVATGDKPETTRTFTIDLFDLTPEERQAIVVHLGVDRIGYVTIDMQSTDKFDPDHYGNDKLKSRSISFDAQPTIGQVIEWIVNYQAEKAESKAHLAKVAAEKKAETDRKAALYNDARPQVEAMIEAENYGGLGTFTHPGLSDWHPKGKDSIYTLIRVARKEITAKRSYKAKAVWIATEGSDRLKRGYSAGHDCQRLYVIERAALEAPNFTVDFNDSASWKDRSCPTAEALDAADDAKAIADALNLASPIIVWLTAEPSNSIREANGYPETEWYEPFEPREAVIIRKYLGKRDLVQII